MADTDEVCGCNGVTKGTICKAIKEKGLFTLDEVRKHTKASASCGSCTGLVEQLLMFTAGGDFSVTPPFARIDRNPADILLDGTGTLWVTSFQDGVIDISA